MRNVRRCQQHELSTLWPRPGGSRRHHGATRATATPVHAATTAWHADAAAATAHVRRTAAGDDAPARRRGTYAPTPCWHGAGTWVDGGPAAWLLDGRAPPTWPRHADDARAVADGHAWSRRLPRRPARDARRSWPVRWARARHGRRATHDGWYAWLRAAPRAGDGGWRAGARSHGSGAHGPRARAVRPRPATDGRPNPSAATRPRGHAVAAATSRHLTRADGAATGHGSRASASRRYASPGCRRCGWCQACERWRCRHAWRSSVAVWPGCWCHAHACCGGGAHTHGSTTPAAATPSSAFRSCASVGCGRGKASGADATCAAEPVQG